MMKSYLFAIAILCIVSTGFNISVDAEDDINHSHLKQLRSLSTDLAQNVETVPQSANDYNNRGIRYYELGEKEKALADYNQAIRLNPNSAKAYNNRGHIYYELGEKEKALADFNQAIRLNPNYADAYFRRGHIYYQSGNIFQSKKDLEKASSLFQQQGNIQMYQIAIQFLNQLP